MGDKFSRHELEPPLNHELDNTSGEWKWRCEACGRKSATSPTFICEACEGEMRRITEGGGTVEAHK